MNIRDLLLLALLTPVMCSAQQAVSNPPPEDMLAPTWETQKQARTYLLAVPAPRGQITDRNGLPFAQSRIGYNLAIQFPTPLDFSNRTLLYFVREQLATARRILSREIDLTEEQVTKYYEKRGLLPLEIASDLLPAEIAAFKETNPEHLVLTPLYLRFYPNGQLAAHILGYVGKRGRTPDSPIQNNDFLWPEFEGREGIEQTFNEQLTGKIGQINIALDATGKNVSRHMAIPPQPGYNVVTTLDENIQRLAEQVLSSGAKRGALVIIDPNNGDILAMASWPEFNPNAFVPAISAEDFAALQNDPDIPLLPRAYRSAYPPGSTFKVVVGCAAFDSGTITPESQFSCPTAYNVGNFTFHNWKKSHMGMLNFVEALTQSCNTWFYQVGLRTGSGPIIDWAHRLGLAEKTGIPLIGEVEGRIPTDEYMKKVHGRKLLPGDVANLAIGQGDILISPLQMAQAMATIANGGTLYQTRLVRQVQSLDQKIVTAYDVRPKEQLYLQSDYLEEIKAAMTGVVASRMGTAGRASVPKVKVAGKTGTAQWGPKKKERTAAWFAGFAPADEPKYAFAALYEGSDGEDVHGGTNAAPLIGKVLRELFKQPAKEKEDGEQEGEEASETQEQSQDEE
jgi:penicillin-binding protein 2